MRAAQFHPSSIILISSSVKSYSLYTRLSISRSVASIWRLRMALAWGVLGLLLVQVQHPLDQGNHLVVVGSVGGVVEVNGTDGELLCF